MRLHPRSEYAIVKNMETEYENFLWQDTFGVRESKEDELCTVWNGVEVEIRCIDVQAEPSASESHGVCYTTFLYRIHSIDWDTYRTAFPKRMDNCFDDVESRLYSSRAFRDDTDECHEMAQQYLEG